MYLGGEIHDATHRSYDLAGGRRHHFRSLDLKKLALCFFDMQDRCLGFLLTENTAATSFGSYLNRPRETAYHAAR